MSELKVHATIVKRFCRETFILAYEQLPLVSQTLHYYEDGTLISSTNTHSSHSFD
jgi:hypothetical protein